MDYKKKIFTGLTAIAIAAVFGVIIYYVTKQFKAICPSGQMLGKDNICRDICDSDKGCDPTKNASCTHYNEYTKTCEKCGSGLIWDGSICKRDCSGHGTYDTKQEKCICELTPGKLYPPTIMPKEGGWTGDNCEIDKNVCTTNGKQGGTPGAPEDLLNYPKFTPIGKNTTSFEKKPCSGHGILQNMADYKGCECVCDGGWIGPTCDTAKQKNPGSCKEGCNAHQDNSGNWVCDTQAPGKESQNTNNCNRGEPTTNCQMDGVTNNCCCGGNSVPDSHDPGGGGDCPGWCAANPGPCVCIPTMGPENSTHKCATDEDCSTFSDDLACAGGRVAACDKTTNYWPGDPTRGACICSPGTSPGPSPGPSPQDQITALWTCQRDHILKKSPTFCRSVKNWPPCSGKTGCSQSLTDQTQVLEDCQKIIVPLIGGELTCSWPSPPITPGSVAENINALSQCQGDILKNIGGGETCSMIPHWPKPKPPTPE